MLAVAILITMVHLLNAGLVLGYFSESRRLPDTSPGSAVFSIFFNAIFLLGFSYLGQGKHNGIILFLIAYYSVCFVVSVFNATTRKRGELVSITTLIYQLLLSGAMICATWFMYLT